MHISHLLKLNFQDAHYLPHVDLVTPSTKNSTIQSSAPQPRQNPYALGPNSRVDANLRYKYIDNQITHLASEGNLTKKPKTEASIRRRREQNRNS
jgi:hypothetical protein